jgi:LPS-assembly lipoprotein
MRAPIFLSAAFAAALLAAPLAGCGFTPMYGGTASGSPAIGPVIVDEVPGKSGFVLKMELDRLLSVERGTGAARRLQVRLSEAVSGLGFRVDTSASRSDLLLNASYVFYDADGKELFRGAENSVASYDIPADVYGEIAAQNDARERAAAALAEKLRAAVALHLAAVRRAGTEAKDRKS